ncbi:MAG: UDP-glucose 6-dehydrogenase [Candidatus Omnitrophica bacterium CG11_big_fil_rev_8_21_14_0_20_45_26]|uniref:UDP-glucose 6-dehydrogenase n=1 Tax=Candidatus Abzuiibacterium crystallinum TaxID=1974748 RepID=A0A2H0LLT6_9BACT|nr:MAG: UDP-glucose 6-dehydrogenase [Candidatus Omnitrophica bacterium CG11_big_fil_rev_8_21_14_0_20_45_26]PIW63241.1 MAG: UDP-glucose 6-dehydrogenase [Candidatus Omnitrophica bacterium CG12_big_fil_rev_8_21_14_0_65_45_16]
MQIGIIGSGHVGLVTGACFADLGHDVHCIDSDEKKIRLLKKGGCPIYEPELHDLIKRSVLQKRLRFSHRIRDAVENCDILFICVGTPTKETGETDLSAVTQVAEQIAHHMKKYTLIVEKSTVPVETCLHIKKVIQKKLKRKIAFDVASNPEFLREGSAVQDFFVPDRIVIGVDSKKAEELLRIVYRPFRAPILVTDPKSSEIIKHASNSFLSTKISFINAIARLCDAVGADVGKVAEGMGLDPRINRSFLNAGLGFGGFCFPKDLAAFIHIAEKNGVEFNLLKDVLTINHEQKMYFVRLVEKMLGSLKGKKLAVLGLSFKPNTDDMRFAPSLDIIPALQKRGAQISAYDPVAIAESRTYFKQVKFTSSVYEACRKVDGILILTEWREFQEMDLNRIRKIVKKPVIIDGRNMYDPQVMRKNGFKYQGIGKGFKSIKR